ncbi:MAG: endonuclease/exonuclease/phosphatase family protein [Desulfobacterales bacterium]
MGSKQNLLALATYNIHRCIGNDDRFDPDRIIKVIKQLDADIIVLQEVENSRMCCGTNLLDHLGEQSRMKIIPGLTMFREESSYGNVLLTRRTIENIEHIDISVKNREPRGAICIRLKINNKKVQIIATHLGLLRSERIIQVQKLLKALKKNPADISVLMGDLNEWYKRSQPLWLLRKYFVYMSSPATFPARIPIFALDRILIQPGSYLKSIATLKNSLTKISSDHLPLRASLFF